MSLPENYKEGVERVSNIVSFKFPFAGTDGEKRYKDWLKDKGIDEAEYMEGACSMGTYVHEALEHHILGRPRMSDSKFLDCEKEVNHGIEWIDNLKLHPDNDIIETEKYVLEEGLRFQGSVDLLYRKDGERVLADYKTFGIVKKRYNLDNKFTVPTAKKKKVLWQMSLYCYALRQQGVSVTSIQLLFVHENGLKVVEMEPLADEVIEELLEQFEAKKYLF